MKAHAITPARSFSYAEYKDLVFGLVQRNSATGPEQSAERINATKLNVQRIKRLDKTISINKDLSSLTATLNRKWKWTVLLESWCGDGAQIIPVVAKIASLNTCIDLSFILRDENPDIMDKHLTNGSRSIPILICTDEITGIEVGTWGPRPKQIVEIIQKYKKENPQAGHEDFIKHLHLLYARDNGGSIQADFLMLLRAWQKITLSFTDHPSHHKYSAEE